MKRTLVLLFVVSFAVPVMAASKLSVAAWIPYWKKTAGTAETLANLNQLAEISPFSYTVGKNGQLIDTAKLAEAPWPELFRAARVKKVKILPSILWTDSLTIDKVLAATTTRRAQITALLAEVKKYGFDGLDIDYENKLASTSPYFSTFLRELGTDLRGQGKTLSCTVEARTPPASRYLTMPAKLEYANDYKALNKYCDQVRLMTYDQGTVDIKLNLARRRGGFYFPLADPTWVRKVLDLAVKDISPKKIMLGVPTYGYELEITDKIKFFDYEQVRSLSYKDFLTTAKTVGATIRRDNAGEAYLTYTSTTTGKVRFVSFSDAPAIAAKVRIAKQYGLRGVVIFKVDGESDNYWPELK